MQLNPRPVQHELRFHPRPHRNVVLDGDAAVRERRRAVIVGLVRDADRDVAAQDAPRRFVVFVPELTAFAAERFHGHREAARAGAIGVAPREARKIVLPWPFLDQHRPVDQLDGGNREIGPPGERRRPIELQRQLSGRKEGPIARVQPVDDQVLNGNPARVQMNLERTEVESPFDVT